MEASHEEDHTVDVIMSTSPPPTTFASPPIRPLPSRSSASNSHTDFIRALTLAASCPPISNYPTAIQASSPSSTTNMEEIPSIRQHNMELPNPTTSPYPTLISSPTFPQPDPSSTINVETPPQTSHTFLPPTPARPVKRRRLSVSLSTTFDTPSTPTPSSPPRTRQLRKAAIQARALAARQAQEIYEPSSRSRSTAVKCTPTKTKEKPKAKKEVKGRNGRVEKMKAEVEEESEDEDDFECPCGEGCGSESECENKAKENMVRDVGMSVILTSTTTINLIVGTLPTQQSFIVHKELLAIHSDYFAALFASDQLSTSTSWSSSFVRSSNDLQDALKGAMRSASLKVGGGIKAEVGVGNGMGLDVKVEILDEDSDDDFAMISSDQYYTSMQKKGFATPTSTPQKPAKNTTTSTSQTPSINILGKSPTTVNNNINNTLPAPTLLQTPKQEIYTLPTNSPLALSLFLSYIYTGSLPPSLTTLTDTHLACTWEALWALGHSLQSPSFMNFCMEGLRGLESVNEGTWPSPREARSMWNSCLTSTPFVNDVSAKEAASLGQTLTPLHRFTATLISYASPLTHLSPVGPTSTVYRGWKQTLANPAYASLSLAIHGVDTKRFVEKAPWDDEFRNEWRVPEIELTEKWRRVVEAEIDSKKTAGGGGVRDSRLAIQMRRSADIGGLLKMMSLKGERWVGRGRGLGLGIGFGVGNENGGEDGEESDSEGNESGEGEFAEPDGEDDEDGDTDEGGGNGKARKKVKAKRPRAGGKFAAARV